MKNYVGQPWFFLFNITFISFAQSVLLFFITTPGYVLLLASRLSTANNQPALELGDWVGAGAMITFVIISAISDQQQWNFQNAKQEYKKTARVPAEYGHTQEELDRGFLTTGLFSASRHPNFAAEQGVWVTLHIWCCYITDSPFNWTGIGALAYLILFQASTWLTELLSAKKYPEYTEYQQQVGKFFPMNKFTGPPVFQKDARKQIADAAAKEKDAQKARERYNLR